MYTEIIFETIIRIKNKVLQYCKKYLKTGINLIIIWTDINLIYYMHIAIIQLSEKK